MTLPVISLNEIHYFIDFRLKELRQCNNPHERIPFSQLKDEGEFYTVKFIKGTKNELPKSGAMYPFGELIECEIPAFIIDHPASMVEDILKNQN